MRNGILLFIVCCVLTGIGRAEVAPLEARVPNAKAWVGQRVPFFIDLRSKGSFSGMAKFDLPRIPGALVIKIGSPVVDSRKIDGQEWFIQRHEFALFSQSVGKVKIPSFSVRFSRRDGFSGPVSEVNAQTAVLTLEVERPPGSEQIGFLVTTDVLEITETWDPEPTTAEVGAMFKRTITQRAEQLPGMALAPVPGRAPKGIRIYPGSVETNDKLQRGSFVGERIETITYLLQESGTLEVPALTYVWWNPKTQTLQSKTLPAVTFEVAASPAKTGKEQSGSNRSLWLWISGVALLTALVVWQRTRLTALGRRWWLKLNPPDRVAARRLLRACRKNDAEAAEIAWVAWRKTQGRGFLPERELHAAVFGMQRFLFHPEAEGAWQGGELERVFSSLNSNSNADPINRKGSGLPMLNPNPKQH